MIVITTPTGSIGSQTLSNLLDSEERLRVIARDPSKLHSEVRDRVEVIEGSHGDPDVVGRALEGADSVFWLVAPNPQAEDIYDAYVEFSRPGVEAAKAHGVQRAVVVSALGRGYGQPAGMLSAAQRMVDLWADSGISLRELAMPGFMDNVLGQVDAIKHQATIYGTTRPDLKQPHVATKDIAAIAARLLSDDGWSGQELIAVLGPQNLTFPEAAAEISQGIGKEITYTHIPFDAFREQLVGAGFSDAAADGMVEMMVAKDDGIDNLPVPSPEFTTPTSFRQWAETVLRPVLDQ